MNFQEMEYIKKIGQCQSVSRAAEALFISQPALSRTVQQVQREFGVQLFRKRKHSIVATAEGEIILRYIDQILQTRQQIGDYFSRAAHQHSPVTVIFTVSIRPLFLVMPELTEQPGLRLEQLSMHRDRLDTHPWDLFLFASEREIHEKNTVELTRETFCFAMSKYHSLAGHASLTLEEIQNKPLILPSSQTKFRNALNQIFKENNFVPKIAMETDNFDRWPDFLDQSEWIAVAPDYSAGFQFHPQLSLLSWKGCDMRRILYLSWNKTKPLSGDAAYVRDWMLHFFIKESETSRI